MALFTLPIPISSIQLYSPFPPVSLSITYFLYTFAPKTSRAVLNLHQPSTTATVVKIRCGNKFNFKNKSL